MSGLGGLELPNRKNGRCTSNWKLRNPAEGIVTSMEGWNARCLYIAFLRAGTWMTMCCCCQSMNTRRIQIRNIDQSS
jgi:hypothetical protein